MKRAVLTVALALLGLLSLAWLATNDAHASALPTIRSSPMAYLECLNRHTRAELLEHAAPWEAVAIEVILEDADRELSTMLPSGVFGFAHFTPSGDRLEVGLRPSSPIYQTWTQALGYSDSAAALQLHAWRRLIGPAVRAWLAHGWPPEEAAALANSTGSGWLVARAEACDWERPCVRAAYATTRHRSDRLVSLDRRLTG